jgi:cell division protease FtsH
MTGNKQYSDETSKHIDDEVRRIVDDCYNRAKKILQDNVDILHAMKNALIEYETIDAEQVDDLMARRKVRPPKDWYSSSDPGDSGGSASKDEDIQKAPSSDKPIGGPAGEV